MSKTHKDHPDRKAMRQRHQDIGAATLLGYNVNDQWGQDPVDSWEAKHALADYIRQGGFVDFLLGRVQR